MSLFQTEHMSFSRLEVLSLLVMFLTFYIYFQVLKTEGHLDVQQDEAYGDILLHETSKSKPTLELEPES